MRALWNRRHAIIAALAVVCIVGSLLWPLVVASPGMAPNLLLWIALAAGGGPLVIELAVKLFRREFGSDLLAGISIVTAVLLQE